MKAMFFLISFYIALALFAAGTLYKIFKWFSFRMEGAGGETSTPARVSAAFKGILKTLASRKLFTLIRVFLLDGLLQIRILRESILRWFMHMCLFAGFLLLFLMHALDGVITAELFDQYMATINPYWFLRDLLGALVIVGLSIALVRRLAKRKSHFISNFQDYYALAIIAVILLSGILLNGFKITSYSSYQDMVYSYGGMASEAEKQALEAYWVENFGVVAPHPVPALDAERLAMAKEFHEMSCAMCHSSSQSAFLSYGAARLLSPAAAFLDRLPTGEILWYIHYLAGLLMLAYLPFSKMFHILTAPASLMINAVMDKNSDAANMATRQAVELDACTHCGTCTRNCSVKMLYETMPNPAIFPSEKINAIKALGSGGPMDIKKLRELREGVFLCSNCLRCTVVCPVGINLQAMWETVREKLLAQASEEFYTLSPFSFYRSVNERDAGAYEGSRPAEQAQAHMRWMFPIRKDPEKPVCLTPAKDELPDKAPAKPLSADARSFAYCFGCQTCTTVCPVAANYEDAEAELGLLPHQIMHCLALGMREATLGAPMLWYCLTCYQCQEQCPQGVKVTDIFYELKNMAISEAKEREESMQSKEFAQ